MLPLSLGIALATGAPFQVPAGLARLALAAVRVARSVLAVSPVIVHGLPAGIGVTLALAQLHVALGGAPHGSALNVLALPERLVRLHPTALSAGAVTVGLLPARPRIPGAANCRAPETPRRGHAARVNRPGVAYVSTGGPFPHRPGRRGRLSGTSDPSSHQPLHPSIGLNQFLEGPCHPAIRLMSYGLGHIGT